MLPRTSPRTPRDQPAVYHRLVECIDFVRRRPRRHDVCKKNRFPHRSGVYTKPGLNLVKLSSPDAPWYDPPWKFSRFYRNSYVRRHARGAMQHPVHMCGPMSALNPSVPNPASAVMKIEWTAKDRRCTRRCIGRLIILRRCQRAREANNYPCRRKKYARNTSRFSRWSIFFALFALVRTSVRESGMQWCLWETRCPENWTNATKDGVHGKRPCSFIFGHARPRR